MRSLCAGRQPEPPTLKRVVVNGGGGFIGASLVRRLLERGDDVHLLLRPESRDWRLREILSSTHRHLLGGEHNLREMLRAIAPDWIFNLAAHGAYPFQTNTAEMIATNVEQAANMLRAAVDIGFESYVHAGSSSEYGWKDHAPSELEVLEPNSDYGVTKAAAAMWCQMESRRSGANIKVLRLYSVYGPWEEPSRLIPRLLSAAMTGAWPPLASPSSARDFVYVDDVVDAFLAATAPTGAGEIFNVGTGQQCTLRETVDAVQGVFKVPSPPRWDSMPPRSWDTNCWVSNSSKMLEVLGWSSLVTLQQGLQRTLNWLLEATPELREAYRKGQAPL